jgi:glycosidase
MFASRVAEYNADTLIGTDATTARDNFDAGHPLYREIARLAKIRRETPALSRGATILRASSDKPGLFAVSRIDPQTGREVVVAFNTSTATLSGHIAVDPASSAFSALAGPCPARPAAPGSIALSLPAFGYAVCAARD